MKAPEGRYLLIYELLKPVDDEVQRQIIELRYPKNSNNNNNGNNAGSSLLKSARTVSALLCSDKLGIVATPNFPYENTVLEKMVPYRAALAQDPNAMQPRKQTKTPRKKTYVFCSPAHTKKNGPHQHHFIN